jgi:hypothetical protein
MNGIDQILVNAWEKAADLYCYLQIDHDGLKYRDVSRETSLQARSKQIDDGILL